MKKWIADMQQYLQENKLFPIALGTGWNFMYALFNGILGLYYHSYWFITLCAFFAALGFMKLSAVTIKRSKHRTELSVMKHNGIAMMFLSVILCGITLLTIREQQNPHRNIIVMLIIAMYTFCVVMLSIRNIVAAHKGKSVTMITIRNITCAGAIGSILSLERGMLGTFGDASDTFSRLTEAISGGVAFFLIIALGIGMVLYANHYDQGNRKIN